MPISKTSPNIDTSINNYRATLRHSLPMLRSRYMVRQLWLYGPHARGKGADGIPLDILADIAGTLTYEDFQELQTKLGQLLGIPVDAGRGREVRSIPVQHRNDGCVVESGIRGRND